MKNHSIRFRLRLRFTIFSELFSERFKFPVCVRVVHGTTYTVYTIWLDVYISGVCWHGWYVDRSRSGIKNINETQDASASTIYKTGLPHGTGTQHHAIDVEDDDDDDISFVSIRTRDNFCIFFYFCLPMNLHNDVILAGAATAGYHIIRNAFAH